MDFNTLYCGSLTNYKRRKTYTVQIGDTPLGEVFPIRLQSMTNTDTADIEKTCKQIKRIVNAGCEYVRITVPSKSNIQDIIKIKKSLDNKIPLIADVHFNAQIAIDLASHIDKIRVNPGNFYDKKTELKNRFTDEEYQNEIIKLEKAFVPLINECLKYNTVLRIGTNHGSLSNRILNQYGNTPLGMVEATMEFLRIAHKYKFKNIVVSLKASNSITMVHATRLLVAMMNAENMKYPLHLGVTEAGEGKDGRIKSAFGIGALLLDGIGDTVRVSLTEPPENEIPIANKIIMHSKSYHKHLELPEIELFYSPYSYNECSYNKIKNIGANNVPLVIVEQSNTDNLTDNVNNNPDFIYNNNKIIDKDLNEYCYFTADKFLNQSISVDDTVFVEINENVVDNKKLYDKIVETSNLIIVINPENANKVGAFRYVFSKIYQTKVPVILKLEYDVDKIENLQIKAAVDCGGILTDFQISGLFIVNNNYSIKLKQITELSYQILQVSGQRITKNEYISCPGCGRTRFNLQESVKKVKKATMKYKNLKIAVMGCIVNGPGEMVDADYGYIGMGNSKVSLFKGKELVKSNIDEINAVNELIELIEKNI